MKEENPIEESRRYVKNARKALRENGDLDVEQNRYRDDKYVKAAGNYLWGRKRWIRLHLPKSDL